MKNKTEKEKETTVFSFEKKAYQSCQHQQSDKEKILGVLDAQHDPLRGKLLLHGKQYIGSNRTTQWALPPEGAESNHAWHQACIMHP